MSTTAALKSVLCTERFLIAISAVGFVAGWREEKSEVFGVDAYVWYPWAGPLPGK